MKIIKLLYFFVVFGCFISCSGHVTTIKPNSGLQLHELNVRGGLVNFFAHVNSEDTIRVAYLGGSITAQNGWRVLSFNWFKEHFPKARFLEINAAIGGTGSDFGAFRLKDHVLKYNPDLLFVEFAVNDANTSPEKIKRSMEGIVRQVWQQNSETDICFVYTFRESFYNGYQKNELPASVLAMEEVAAYYNIPTINLGVEVSQLVSEKSLIIKGQDTRKEGVGVFSRDGVHPNVEIGHPIYLGVVQRSFKKMRSAKDLFREHKIQKPLALNCFCNTQMIDVEDLNLSGGWTIAPISENPGLSKFGNYLGNVAYSTHDGALLTLHFKGQAIGAYDIKGPESGRVILELDGLIKDTINRFDKYCISPRMNYFIIDKLEDREHTAVFRVLSDPFDKAGILKQKDNVMKDPEEYKENRWIIGKILLDGAVL